MTSKGSTYSALAFLSACAIAIAVGFALVATTPAAYANDGNGLVATRATGTDAKNLEGAKAKYGITDDCVFFTNEYESIQAALSAASREASAGNRQIVYAPSGTYYLTDSVIIPQNVLFVGEDTSKFVASDKFEIMFKTAGSIYGGFYDGARKCTFMLRIDNMKHVDGNGTIEKAKVKNAVRYGITSAHDQNRDAQILDCEITNCGWSGISILDGAYVKLISNCDVSDNGTAGINLSHADVGTIKKCTINNNKDKAVSTNSDPVNGYKQPGCNITTITGCTIKNGATNGVYLKPKCSLKNFTNNVVVDNKGSGLTAIATTVAGTTGKSVVKNVSGNTFKGNYGGQVRASGLGSSIIMGSNNKVLNGPEAGIASRDKGVLKVTGSNNTVKNNKGSGLNASGAAKITVTGSKNVISAGSGKFALYCRENSTITLKNVKVSGRVYTASGAKVKTS